MMPASVSWAQMSQGRRGSLARQACLALVALALLLSCPAPFHAYSQESPAGYRTLAPGDSGEDVLALKHRMYELGYFSRKVTSDSYTDTTAGYIKKAQAANGMIETGVATPEFQSLVFSESVVPQEQAGKVPVPDGNALQPVSVRIAKKKAGLQVNLSFRNVGQADIVEFGAAFAFYGRDGRRFLAWPADLEGFVQEPCSWRFVPGGAGIRPGKTYNTEEVLSGVKEAAGLFVALRYYVKADGETVHFPESEWAWVGSDRSVLNDRAERAFYHPPGAAVKEAADSYRIGYGYFLLDDFNAPLYGFSGGGEWVHSVDEGSLAQALGLMPGDLILSVNGVRFADNVYATDEGKAKAAGGVTVELVVERAGAQYPVLLPAGL